METTTLPRIQDATCGFGINPVESEPARVALVEAYKALLVLREGHLLDFLAEQAHDPMVRAQCLDAISTIEDSMSPNLLVTVLPAYTKVRFATDLSRAGHVSEGLVREGAWGLHPTRSDSTTRRITTEGWEFFVTPETNFVYFEVVELGR